MRLSNIFIYGSLTIIVSLSLGFLVYQTFDRSADDEKQNPEQLSQRIAELEAENEALLDESAITVENLSTKVTSLNDDLHRSSKLLMEKDNEIAQLKASLDSSTIHAELSKALNCRPEAVPETVAGLVTNYADLQRRFQIVNQQLAATNTLLAQAKEANTESTTVPAADGNNVDADPQVNLNRPKNNLDKNSNANAGTDSPKKQELANSRNPDTKTSVQSLVSRISQLENRLKNREKLLFEQTSLIEALKKSNNRIETGFRTGKNANDGVPANFPFRDRGTFRVKNQ